MPPSSPDERTLAERFSIANAPTFVDRSTVRFERRLACAGERAWEAISTKAELDRWFMTTELELWPGGRFAFERGWEGTIGEVAPLRCIQFDASDKSFSRFELVPGPDGATTDFALVDRLPPDFRTTHERVAELISMQQPGGPGTHWAGVLAGWHGYADALACHVAGRPFVHEYAQLCERYAGWLVAYWAGAGGERDG